jgi:hypothetical protein
VRCMAPNHCSMPSSIDCATFERFGDSALAELLGHMALRSLCSRVGRYIDPRRGSGAGNEIQGRKQAGHPPDPALIPIPHKKGRIAYTNLYSRLAVR